MGKTKVLFSVSDAHNLFQQRLDTITFYDDGDGTYSYQTSKYCLFDDNASKANEPCSGEYALVNGTLIIKAEGLSSYTFKKVSPTRVEFHKGSGSSFSLISYQLSEKKISIKLMIFLI